MIEWIRHGVEIEVYVSKCGRFVVCCGPDGFYGKDKKKLARSVPLKSAAAAKEWCDEAAHRHEKIPCPSCTDGTLPSGCYPCDRCGGFGLVPVSAIRWIEDGKKMRAQRMHSPDGFRSINEEAARRGLSAETLCLMERGIIKPILN